MSKKVLKLSISAIMALILIFAVYKIVDCSLNNPPILKLVLRTQGHWISSGKYSYFTIYSNGKYKVMDEFKQVDVETYSFDEVRKKYESGETLDSTKSPPYAVKIIEIADEIGNSYISGLYIINGNYYFSLTDTRTVNTEYSCALYEYFPDTGGYKKIVAFDYGSIVHVEAY